MAKPGQTRPNFLLLSVTVRCGSWGPASAAAWLPCVRSRRFDAACDSTLFQTPEASSPNLLSASNSRICRAISTMLLKRFSLVQKLMSLHLRILPRPAIACTSISCRDLQLLTWQLHACKPDLSSFVMVEPRYLKASTSLSFCPFIAHVCAVVVDHHFAYWLTSLSVSS